MLRWGIFGTGYISGRFAEGVNRSEHGSVYAAASRSEQTAKAFAAEFGAQAAYGSYQALIDDDNVDVYYIGLPNHLHYEYTAALLKKGKHVLCEKPLGLNAKQSKEMVRLARENGVFFMEAMWTRCFPAVRKVREWVDSGVIGKVNFVQASFGLKSQDGWRHDAKYGGGALLDVGIYPMAMAFAVLGSDYQQTVGAARLNERGVDINNCFILKYENGAMAKLSSSFDYITDNRVVISGSNGQIVMDGEWWHSKKATKSTGMQKLFSYEFENTEVFEQDYKGAGFHYEADHVAECISAGLTESPLFTHSETVRIAEAMDELRRQFGVVYSEDE